MSISIKIHNTDLVNKYCVVTIKDDDVVIVDHKNIGLELNPDGTANTTYITNRAKFYVGINRTINSASTIAVSGHPHPIKIGE